MPAPELVDDTGAARPIHVVENNPYAPQPFVLTEVAVCLRDAIRAAGHPCEHVVNRVDPLAWSIVLGGSPSLPQQLAGLDPRRCAIFNFEQLGSTSILAGPDYRQWLRDWLVLDYHSSNIEFLRRENGPAQQALELPLVPSPALAVPGAEEKTVDVLFYGTLSERRQAVLRQLEALGLKVEVVSGAYGNELAPAVRRARLVLHIHYYASGLFPVARVLQPVMQGVPVVCEASVFSRLGDWSDSGILFAPYEQLGEACAALLAQPAQQAARAAQARAFAAAIDIRAPLQAVLQAFAARERQDSAGRVPAAPRELGPDGQPLLSNEEIEAILAQEAADAAPPPAGQPPAEFNIVRREPGQGFFGRWVAWLLIAFILVGAARMWQEVVR